jgi:hypothetical protein
MGGALASVAVIALLVIGGVALALFVGTQRNGQASDPGHTPPPAPDQRPADPKSTPGTVERRQPAPPAIVDPKASSLNPTQGPVPASSGPSAPGRVVRAVDPKTVPPPPVDVKAASPVDDGPQPASQQVESVLAAAIREANRAELQAYSTLNAAPLSRSYVGQALQKRIGILQLLLANQTYALSTLHRQEFDSFLVSADGRHATVRLTEVWSSNFHSVYTRLCAAHFHERPVPQTVLLRQTGQGWMIYEREAHEPDPALAPCHQ